MIQREWQTVKVFEYNGLDAYGQDTISTSSRDVEMVVKLYSQANVENPKYLDIELLGITKDKTIEVKNVIQINGRMYGVQSVIPSGKYLQVLMKNYG